MDSHDWTNLDDHTVRLPDLPGSGATEDGPAVKNAGPYGAACYIDPVRRNPTPMTVGTALKWIAYVCFTISILGLGFLAARFVTSVFS